MNKEEIRCEIKQIKDELRIYKKNKNVDMIARYNEMLDEAKTRLRNA